MSEFKGWKDITKNITWSEPKSKLLKLQKELSKHYGEKVIVWGGGDSGGMYATLKNTKILPTFLRDSKGFALKAYLITEKKQPYHDDYTFEPWIGSYQISVKDSPVRSNPEMLLTSEQRQELARLQAYYPYRIIYGMIDKDSGEFFASAVISMRIPNKMAREGHKVFVLKNTARNPVEADAPSSSLYQSFHGKPVQSQRVVQFNPPKGKVVKIGRVKEIVYTVEGNSKFDGTNFSHKAGDIGHKMLPSNTLIVSSEDGKDLYLIKENEKSEYPKFSGRGILG